jgi:L-asparagine transporter-like permease
MPGGLGGKDCMAPPFRDKFGNGGRGIGPRNWQGWLTTLATILVAVGAAMAATQLSDVPRWIPLIVIILTLAGIILLLSVKTEGDDW